MPFFHLQIIGLQVGFSRVAYDKGKNAKMNLVLSTRFSLECWILVVSFLAVIAFIYLFLCKYPLNEYQWQWSSASNSWLFSRKIRKMWRHGNVCKPVKTWRHGNVCKWKKKELWPGLQRWKLWNLILLVWWDHFVCVWFFSCIGYAKIQDVFDNLGT